METSTSAATGWPFLVAAGRRRDYTTLLAPRFLVAELDHGVLEQVVRPDSGSGPPTVVGVRSGRGRRLCVVYATHLLTERDLGGSDARDEHGRPLRLIYGFVTPDASVVAPAAADLRRVLAEALRVYRSFLADEEGVAIVGAAPIRLESTVEVPVEVPAEVPARVAGRSRSPSLPSRSSRTRADRAGTDRSVRLLAALAAAVVLVVIAVGAALWSAGRPGTPSPGPGACASSFAPGGPPPATAGPSSSCRPPVTR